MFGFAQNPLTRSGSYAPAGGGGITNLLATLGATLRDIDNPGSNTLLTLQASRQAQAEKAQKQALLQGLLTKMGGEGGASGLPSLRAVGPDLLAAQAAGVDIGGLVSLLDKAGPQIDFVNGVAVDKGAVTPGSRVGVNLSNVNGTLLDTQDPRNAGIQVPEMEKGMLRVVGPDGLPMAIPVQNYDQILANRAGAVAGAEAAAKSPFDFINVPTPSGAPRTLSKARAAGGDFTGQTPQAKVLAEAQARTQAEREAAQPNKFIGLEDQARTTQLVIDSINKALDQIGPFSAGFGANLSPIKGLQAHDLESTLATIRANIGFDRLAQMRENSPTGGALGNVSEQENRLLASVMGSLDQGQSPEQLKTNLARIRDELVKISGQRQRLYQETYGQGSRGSSGGRSQARAAPSVGQTVNGYRYKGGNPRDPNSWQKVN